MGTLPPFPPEDPRDPTPRPPAPDPPPPEPEPDPGSGDAPRGPSLATWGPVETILGIAGTLPAVMLIPGLCGALLVYAGFPADGVVTRYVILTTAFLMLVVVPFAIARRTGGGPRSLGLRAARLRACAEAVGVGALLQGLTTGYEGLIRRLAPELARAMEQEAAKQLELLAGPWPLLALIAVVIAPLCEELLFRGFIFGGLRSRLDFGVASGLSALLFALVHLMAISAIPLFFVGLGCAVMYERHRSLAAPVLTHVTFNSISLVAFFAFHTPPT